MIERLNDFLMTSYHSVSQDLKTIIRQILAFSFE